MTSFRVVACVKKYIGEKHVGHAGTLDPAATGVLPVCLGQGTRLIEYLSDTSKTYQAEIELGVTTDTYDTTGTVTQKHDTCHVTREMLESTLQSFRGTIQQVPPMYSAVRHNGGRLHKLARAGIEVERQSRPARVDNLDLIDWQPPLFTIRVTCGKGTYIRSIAHDVGQALGCGAALKSLVRTAYGPFDVKTAITLSQLEAACPDPSWQRFLHPIDTLVMHLRAVIVNDTTEGAIRQGKPVVLPEEQPATAPAEGLLCRAYTAYGLFLGVLRYNPQEDVWKVEKVFRPG